MADEEIVFELVVKDEKALKQINLLVNSLKKASKQGKDITFNDDFTKGIADAEKIIGELNESLKDTCEEVECANKKTGLLPALFSLTTKGAKGLFKAIKAGIAASGIGTVTMILAGIVQAFSRSEKGAALLRKGFAAINGAISGLINLIKPAIDLMEGFVENPKQGIKDLGQLLLDQIINRFKAIIEIGGLVGKAIGHLASGNFKAVKQLGDEFKLAGEKLVLGLDDKQVEEFNKRVIESVGVAKEATRAQIQLSNARIANAKAIQAVTLAVSGLQAKEEELDTVYNDITRSFGERTAALKQFEIVSEQRAQKQIELARLEAATLQKEIATRTKFGEDVTDLIEQQTTALGAISDAEAELTRVIAINLKERRQLRSDQSEEVIDETRKVFAAQQSLLLEQAGNEELSSDRRLGILQKYSEIAASTYQTQLQELENFLGKKIDIDSLLNESDSVRLAQQIKDVGLGEALTKQLTDIITEQKDTELALSQARVEIKESETKRLENEAKKREELERERYNLSLAALDKYIVEEQTRLIKQLTNKEITEDEFAEKSLQLELDSLKKRKAILIGGGQETDNINKQIAEKELQVQREKDANLEELARLRQERIKKTFEDFYSFLEGSGDRLSNLLSDSLDSDLSAIDARYDYELTRAEGNAKAIAAAEAKQRQDRLKAEAEYAKQKANIQILENAASVTKQTFDSIQEIKKIDNEKEKSKAIAIAALQTINAVQSAIFDFAEQRAQARISRQLADFDRRLEANKDNAQQTRIIEAQKQAFIEKEEKKAAKRRKARAIVDALIATGLAAVQALPNFILSGIVTAIGLTQVAFIAAQKAANGMLIAANGALLDGSKLIQPLKFARGGVPHSGGIAKGKSHAQGGMKGVIRETGRPIEFERNEAIIKAPKGGGDDGYNRTLSDINWMRGGTTFGFPAPSGKRQKNMSVMKYAQGGIPNMKPIKYQNGGIPSEADRQAREQNNKVLKANIAIMNDLKAVMLSLPSNIRKGIEDAELIDKVNTFNTNLQEETDNTTI